MKELLKVLMLEDNPGDAALNEIQLLKAGFTIRMWRVETRQDYLKKLTEFKPDIILADYKLPQFDGLAALKLAVEQYPFIPFIIVSGILEEDAAIELMKAGAADYVLKGNIVRLGTAVKNALELKHAKEEQALAMQRLQASHTQLEQRVKERTSQFEHLNRKLQQEIEERKKIEDELWQNREDFKRAQAVAHIGNWRLDTGKNELKWSDEVYRIFNLPPETSLTYESFLSFVHPEDKESVDTSWQAALKRKKSYDIDHRIIVNGSVRWVHERAELEFDALGNVNAGFGTVQDITDKKLIEEALRKAEEELRKDKENLEKIVAERTKSLLKTERQLARSKQLSEIGTLSAIVAHELRNPLAGISAALFIIERKAAANQAIDKHIAAIHDKLDECTQIIESLLNFTRIKPPQMKVVDLCELIKDSELTITGKMNKPGIRIIDQTPAIDSLVLKADPIQLKEVFNNLFNNAYDALDDKGIIETGIFITADTIKIHIKDNGPGIDESVLDHIFEPFFTTKKKGTGLGLAIAKQIIENHGGNISIASEKGKGTTVAIMMPITDNTGGRSIE